MGNDTVSGAIQKQFGSNANATEKHLLQQSPNGGRSFENILQDGGQTAPNQTAQPPIAAENRVTNDKKLDAMRLDLIERYQTLPDGVPKTTVVLPEFLDVKTRMSAFRDVLNNAIGSVARAPQGTDLKGRFSAVENEWFQLEKFMRSDKELSQGELLGLQARLYQVSQHIDVLSKVVDQMTGGVKTILNTNV